MTMPTDLLEVMASKLFTTASPPLKLPRSIANTSAVGKPGFQQVGCNGAFARTDALDEG